MSSLLTQQGYVLNFKANLHVSVICSLPLVGYTYSVMLHLQDINVFSVGDFHRSWQIFCRTQAATFVSQ
jgi:hypothetical protein